MTVTQCLEGLKMAAAVKIPINVESQVILTKRTVSTTSNASTVTYSILFPSHLLLQGCHSQYKSPPSIDLGRSSTYPASHSTTRDEINNHVATNL